MLPKVAEPGTTLGTEAGDAATKDPATNVATCSNQPCTIRMWGHRLYGACLYRENKNILQPEVSCFG